MKSFSFLTIFLSVIIFSSCKKDEGKIPLISFKTTAGYTSSDVTVAKGTLITMGINASKAEDKDFLKTFDCSQVLDGGAPISIVSEPLSGSTGNTYSKDVQITTRNVAGTEKYIFTVVNKDGLKNSVSLTLTVN